LILKQCWTTKQEKTNIFDLFLLLPLTLFGTLNIPEINIPIKAKIKISIEEENAVFKLSITYIVFAII
jgi:hypothetical protein